MRRLVSCLNPSARRSRLYWLSRHGRSVQRRMRGDARWRPSDFPTSDWELYGWTCYSHRSAIIKAMAQPLHAAAIRRKASANDPALHLSSNNARDALYLLLDRGVVRRVIREGEPHPLYELTDAGKSCRDLLLRAEAPW